MRTSIFNIRRALLMPILIGLAFLTAFSSCAMKKAVQSEVQIDVTKQLNPLKSLTQAQFKCDVENIFVTQRSNAENPRDFQQVPFPEKIGFNFTAKACAAVFPLNFSPSLITNKQALYILFGKMKICA
jgi:hypothetical protein